MSNNTEGTILKRFFLHKKEDTYASPISGLGVLYESHRTIIVTYAHHNEPVRFGNTLKANCQIMQRYHLTKEHRLSNLTIHKDYLVFGINDVAKMIYFAEFGGTQWLAKHQLELLEPRSFYLNWSKDNKFFVEWA